MLNQRLPSGPAISRLMKSVALRKVSGNSLKATEGVRRPILFTQASFDPAPVSVNQRLPSAPTAIERGEMVDEGRANRWNLLSWLIWPNSLYPPLNLGAWSTLGASLSLVKFPYATAGIHRLPSGPSTIWPGRLYGAGTCSRFSLP